MTVPFRFSFQEKGYFQRFVFPNHLYKSSYSSFLIRNESAILKGFVPFSGSLCPFDGNKWNSGRLKDTSM